MEKNKYSFSQKIDQEQSESIDSYYKKGWEKLIKETKAQRLNITEQKECQLIFDKVALVYQDNGIDVSKVKPPDLYKYVRAKGDNVGFYHPVHHALFLSDMNTYQISHEYAHSLGNRKLYFIRADGGGGYTLVEQSNRSGFSHNLHYKDHRTGRREFPSFFKVINEAMKDLIAEKAIKKINPNYSIETFYQNPPYKPYVNILNRIFETLESAGRHEPFRLFLFSDTFGWTRELKHLLLKSFGSHTLKVLNILEFVGHESFYGEENCDEYLRLLMDFFSPETFKSSDMIKKAKGKLVLDFVYKIKNQKFLQN